MRFATGRRGSAAPTERIASLVAQNAVCHQDGLGPLREKRRAFWADRAGHEQALRENFFSPGATRQRHIGKSSHPDRYDPDLWTDELAFLNRRGQDDIQTDLFYDYRTNVASYPVWQRWLRETQPPQLVVWGRYDPSFEVAEAEAYRRDVPEADVHVIDAGLLSRRSCRPGFGAHRSISGRAARFIAVVMSSKSMRP